MNKPKFFIPTVVLAVLIILAHSSPARTQTLSFDQLNWIGTGSSTPDSSWGRMTLDFTGYSDIQYFNLNANGNWAIDNMSIGSLWGSGVSQTLSRTFDLGVPHGTDVTNLDYVYSIGSSPLGSMPTGTFTNAAVLDTDYQIGGEDGIDTGTPGIINLSGMSANTLLYSGILPGSGNTVLYSGKLPDIDKFDNQVQKPNECAPGAISNSLKYLKATGKIDFDQEINDVKTWTPWISNEKGTGKDWYKDKKTYLEQRGMTVRYVEAPLTLDEILFLIEQLKDGQDIEMDLKGHVEVLVGIRVRNDGTVEFDLFDDNQTDNKKDPMHTSWLRGTASTDYVDGKELERFVVECPVPEPTTMMIMAIGGLALLWRRKRR